jgi:hypothetical protein
MKYIYYKIGIFLSYFIFNLWLVFLFKDRMGMGFVGYSMFGMAAFFVVVVATYPRPEISAEKKINIIKDYMFEFFDLGFVLLAIYFSFDKGNIFTIMIVIVSSAMLTVSYYLRRKLA